MKKLFVCLCLCGLAASALAGSLIDVQIFDRSSGRVLETWVHQGRLYVAGTPGNRYAVSLRNRTGGRVLTVLSVDGVNAVSGQTASASQSGYVLAPGRATEVAGWRKNLDEVAAFYFTRLGDSYAGRTGRPQNVGVIGVAVFREYEPPRVFQPAPRDFAELPAGAPPARMEARKAMPSAEEKLGTGHGERIDSQVGTTEFRRASERPAEVIAVYYDSYANLVARGIIPADPVGRRPHPFPGGFVPDPS